MAERNDNNDYLKKKIEILQQERDCAIEMWNLAELVADKSKEEIKLLSSNSAIEILQNEIEDIKRDYSDAINLLDNKVNTLERELKICKESRNEILEENKLINKKLEAEIEKHQKLETFLKDANDKIVGLEKALEESYYRLKESEEREKLARDRVRDALESLQESMEHNDALEEEKQKLEENLSEKVNEIHIKSLREIDSVKTQLNRKIENLSEQLQCEILEKNKVNLECESLKSELRLKIEELQMKNKSLINELNELRIQRQNEAAMFGDERNSLRRQLGNLQTELESALLQLRDKQQAPCHECMELQEHIERFSLLCKKWEEAASSVTLNFEKYAQETKQFYQLQEKAYHLQNDLEHT